MQVKFTMELVYLVIGLIIGIILGINLSMLYSRVFVLALGRRRS